MLFRTAARTVGDRRQTVYVVCGLPSAVEVFAGNAADSTTCSTQAQAMRERLSITRIALAENGDIITTVTSARISCRLCGTGARL